MRGRRPCLILVACIALSALGHAARSAPDSRTPSCSVAGLASAVGARRPRFVIFGELHGTTEIPALFGDATCELSERQEVVVAVEYTQEVARVADAYVLSGRVADRTALLETPMFAAPQQDGRASLAMLGLIDRLADLRRQGRKIRLVGSVPSVPHALPQDYYEIAMAEALARAAMEHPSAVIAVLVGNIHANRDLIERVNLRPAASHLPPADVLSLVNTTAGGAAWNCQADGCGAHDAGSGSNKPRGVEVFTAPQRGYDGEFSVGGKFTPSPPAAPRPAQSTGEPSRPAPRTADDKRRRPVHT